MAQITTGLRSILSHPFIYETLQKIMGAERARKNLISEFITPYAVSTILDIGCGPAQILSGLSQVNYFGFDLSELYISKAQQRFGVKGQFFAKYFVAADVDKLPKMDLVLLIGVLHHLDDIVAADILTLALATLAPGGRILTVDPVYEPGQNPIARFLIGQDRGQNVRTLNQYAALVRPLFDNVDINIRHQNWVPYTHCYMHCSKTGIVQGSE